jgi:NAD(P)-dependent dehydrogenase (short-subunit alcohol dehydrogenase family)
VSKFNGKSTTEDVIQEIDLNGKTAIVTGASAGLGVETSRVLAGAGAKVIMVGRDMDKLGAAANSIVAKHPIAQLELIKMDLADMGSVREAAESILTQHASINILINNAAVMACPFGKTIDGLEMQFGTNHIGHFLFTCLLTPTIVNGGPSRIVNLSSSGHHNGEVNLEDPNFEKRPYEKWLAYGQAKTANVQFSVTLSERLLDKGVRTFAVHPGAIKTELGRHMTAEDANVMAARSITAGGWEYKTVPGGAATSVWAATSLELNNVSGMYLEDCQIADPVKEGSPGGFAPHAIDPRKSTLLWAVSEKIVGQVFNFQG